MSARMVPSVMPASPAHRRAFGAPGHRMIAEALAD
jgi:hypothetical protein